jgi:hypothetical protein
MSWFRVDDTFGDHPKVLEAGNAAIGLWTRCGAWCSRHPSANGVVPKKVASVYGNAREIRRLCDSNLWVKVDGGYLMHDFHDYNATAEQVAENRRQAAERQARWRKRNAVTNASPPDDRNAVTNGTPSHPIPSSSSRSSSRSSLRVPVAAVEDDLNGPTPISHAVADWLGQVDQP